MTTIQLTSNSLVFMISVSQSDSTSTENIRLSEQTKKRSTHTGSIGRWEIVWECSVRGLESIPKPDELGIQTSNCPAGMFCPLTVARIRLDLKQQSINKLVNVTNDVPDSR